ncbi:hypothetical protein P5V15_010453 [Pogonomyrmex californicus]
MIDSAGKAIKPVALTAFIVGCGILKYPGNRPRFGLSIFYMLIVWSVYACVFYYTMIQFPPERLFNSFLTFFILTINLLVTIIHIIIIIRKRKKFVACIRKLELVDDTLEKLGMPKEFDILQNLTKWAMIILIFIICISSILDSMLCVRIYNNIKGILIPFVINYTIHINTLMDIKFILLLRHIGTRMDKMNDYIEQLLKTEDYGIKCKWKKSFVVKNYYVRSIENSKHALWTLM